MNIPKIKYAEALPSYRLFLIFDNGSIKIYDISQKLSQSQYAPLKDLNTFQALKVDAGGYGLSWNDEIDLSENECWLHSREVANISELAKAG